MKQYKHPPIAVSNCASLIKANKRLRDQISQDVANHIKRNPGINTITVVDFGKSTDAEKEIARMKNGETKKQLQQRRRDSMSIIVHGEKMSPKKIEQRKEAS